MAYRVGIVGSGTAGPAAGILLARAGHEVTMFERAPREEAVGAGFLLQPTGLAVIRELGLESEVVEMTRQIDSLYCHTQKEKVLLDLKYAEIGEGFFGLGTHRSSLLRVLLEAYENAGGELRWGEEMVRKEGRFLISKEGVKEGPFDLVLICDGAKSMMRGECGLEAKVSRYPWGALWFIGKRTPEFDERTLWQAVKSTRELCGFLPTGTKDDLLSVFWSVRDGEFPSSLDRWKAEVLDLVPQAEVFLEQVESLDQLQSAAYHDVVMKQWHGGDFALLGDAAHALSPQLGQGVNLALVDASMLARCLSEFSIEEGVAEYTRRRKRHVRFYQWATRLCTPFFQSDLPVLGVMRDVSFPLAMKIPYLRKEFTRTMAGMKTGIFFSSEPGV